MYVVVYLVALAAHAYVASAAPYGDEAFHYAAATRLWESGSNAYLFYSDEPLDFNLLFWQRPVFFLLLAPAAAISFEAFRNFHAVLVSTLPVVIVGLARQFGVGRVLAGSVGIAAALNPSLIVWTTRVFPDGLAATLALTAVFLWTRGRHVGALVTALAATWTKESAGLVLIVLAALWVFPTIANRLHLAATQHNRKPVWGVPVALSIAPLPLAYSLYLGARFPGWVPDGDASTLPSILLGSVLLVPFVIAAFAFKRGRLAAALATGYLLFYAWYAIIYNHQVQGWYIAIPLSLALVAAVIAAHGLDHRWTGRRWARFSPFATILLVVLFALVLFPAGSDLRVAATGGLKGGTGGSLAETSEFIRSENRDFADAIAVYEDLEAARAVVVDTSWLYVYYPFGDARDIVMFARSDYFNVFNSSWRPVIDEIESPNVITVIGSDGYDPDVAKTMREVYHDCIVYANPTYQFVRGADCSGAGAAFLAKHP